MQHAERVHSRAQLLDKVWGDHVYIEERTVDVHVKRLRESLGAGGADGRDGARCRLPPDGPGHGLSTAVAGPQGRGADNRPPCRFVSPLS